jgi:hypothetical protein
VPLFFRDPFAEEASEVGINPAQHRNHIVKQMSDFRKDVTACTTATVARRLQVIPRAGLSSITPAAAVRGRSPTSLTRISKSSSIAIGSRGQQPIVPGRGDHSGLLEPECARGVTAMQYHRPGPINPPKPERLRVRVKCRSRLSRSAPLIPNCLKRRRKANKRLWITPNHLVWLNAEMMLSQGTLATASRDENCEKEKNEERNGDRKKGEAERRRQRSQSTFPYDL